MQFHCGAQAIPLNCEAHSVLQNSQLIWWWGMKIISLFLELATSNKKDKKKKRKSVRSIFIKTSVHQNPSLKIWEKAPKVMEIGQRALHGEAERTQGRGPHSSPHQLESGKGNSGSPGKLWVLQKMPDGLEYGLAHPLHEPNINNWKYKPRKDSTPLKLCNMRKQAQNVYKYTLRQKEEGNMKNRGEREHSLQKRYHKTNEKLSPNILSWI